MDDRELTIEESRELAGYLNEAKERHVTVGPQIAPGFTTRSFDVDVHLPYVHTGEGLHAVLPAMSYLLKLPSEGWNANTDPMPDECEWLWGMHVQDASIETTDDGEEEGRFTASIEPIDRGDGLRLSFFEVLACIAIQDAREAGDDEKAQHIFRLAFHVSGEEPEPPRQDTNKPNRQYDPNSKLANTMTAPALFDSAGALLDVANTTEKRTGKDRLTAVTFSTDDGVELSRPISAYDREVHGAISTLWVSGNRYVTARQVAQTMSGIRNPSKSQTRKVEESIELQRRIMGRIDLKQEARGKRLYFEGEEVTQFMLEGHIINADRVRIKAANGREVDGYYLYRAPLIYQHAAIVGQVVNYPQRLLELGAGSDTDANIIIKRQLLRQVERAKTGGQKSVRFTPDPKNPERPCLFTRAGIDVTDWDKRKAATDYALSILEGLKEVGEISGYTVNRQKVRGGNPVYGVTVKP